MEKKPLILIVDDEKNTRDGLLRALRDDYRVAIAENGMRALEWLDNHTADVVLSDLRMPGMDGMALLSRIQARDPQPICILLTAYGNIETAVEAMRRGAYDFLTKPVNLDRLELLLKRALRERELGEENKQLREALDEKYGFENFIGSSAPMQDVFETIRQVAPTRVTVLIQGESGTGKELAAHALHQLSPRANAPFVPVHCAALSSSLLESELFGHEKGAFTGATERRRGRFEMANGGTLFLDEIGEIDAALQVKILRVLEERQFERVGGAETVNVDVRLVAATNRDLRQMVADGTFREDLFYRLYVVTVQLPALRDRPDDIPLLAQYFLKKAATENGRTTDGMTPDLLNALCRYSWPGNVRELRNVMERMVVLSKTDKLSLRDAPLEIRPGVLRGEKSAAASMDGMEDTPGGTMKNVEKQMIQAALARHDGSRTQAAKELGISRRTLHRKLNQFGLHEKKKSEE